MTDVFSRLFRESTNKSRTEKSRKLRDSIKSKENDEWKLRLAAECYLVDDNSKVTKEQQTPREVYSSLSAISLHHKRSSKKETPREVKTVLSQRRRPVSHIMDRRGDVTRTDNYIITDSIEPSPYTYIKPTRLVGNKYYDHRSEPRTAPFRTERIQKELERSKIKKANWGQLDNLCTTKIEIVNADKMEKANNDQNIMVNMDDELSIYEIPKPTQLISNTGICYDNYGYPDSVSFILDNTSSGLPL